MQKLLLLLVSLFGLQGCIATNANYYVLSLSGQPTTTYANKSRIIGVEKVTIPSYLNKREIAIAKNSSQITLLGNAVWGEDLDTGLTERLISFLQKKFNQPNVYAYPWGVDRQPTVRVRIDITRFIAQGENVYLDANWELKSGGTKRRKSSLFHTVVPTNSDPDSIVSAMDKAFSKLEEAVAKGVRGY
jgi:uncharacterized lipoprotein YmbA